MLEGLNYNVIFLLIISIVFFILDYMSNGRFYKILNKVNKISGQWKFLFVFVVFYFPKLIYMMNKKEEGKSITVYELFGLSNNNYKINNDKINKKRNVSESKKKFVAASQNGIVICVEIFWMQVMRLIINNHYIKVVEMILIIFKHYVGTVMEIKLWLIDLFNNLIKILNKYFFIIIYKNSLYII